MFYEYQPYRFVLSRSVFYQELELSKVYTEFMACLLFGLINQRRGAICSGFNLTLSGLIFANTKDV